MIVNEDREIIISRSFADKLEMIEDWPIYIIDWNTRIKKSPQMAGEAPVLLAK